jgi:hypothetical protein
MCCALQVTAKYHFLTVFVANSELRDLEVKAASQIFTVRRRWLEIEDCKQPHRRAQGMW